MLAVLWLLMVLGVILAGVAVFSPAGRKNEEIASVTAASLHAEIIELKKKIDDLSAEVKRASYAKTKRRQADIYRARRTEPEGSSKNKTCPGIFERKIKEQSDTITYLKGEEKRLAGQLEAAQKETAKAKEELFKRKVMYSELESQLQESRKTSAELSDGLFYEMNN